VSKTALIIITAAFGTFAAFMFYVAHELREAYNLLLLSCAL
jgi:hypothetical protein